MENVNLPEEDLHTEEVKINLHMLGSLIQNGAGGEIDRADVAVTVDKSALGRWVIELVKQLV
jgi:hypothetical protein